MNAQANERWSIHCPHIHVHRIGPQYLSEVVSTTRLPHVLGANQALCHNLPACYCQLGILTVPVPLAAKCSSLVTRFGLGPIGLHQTGLMVLRTKPGKPKSI